MGANRIGDVAELAQLARPTVGLITNAGAEHLEGFGNLDGVARGEGEMVPCLPPPATAIINADDAYAPLWRGLHAGARRHLRRARRRGFHAAKLRTAIERGEFATRFPLHRPLGRLRSTLHARRHAQHRQRARRGGGRHQRRRLARATSPRVWRSCARWRAGCSSNAPRAAPGSSTTPTTPIPARCAPRSKCCARSPGASWLVLGDMAELGRVR